MGDSASSVYPNRYAKGLKKYFSSPTTPSSPTGKPTGRCERLSRLNILSDNRIARIASQDESDLLVVVYDNSNIDLVDMSSERCYNLPYIKNASLTAKGINDISFAGDETYLATDFGIVVPNNSKKEIKTTYTFNEKIASAAARRLPLCMRADYSLYRCPADGIPYDINSWEKLNNSYITQLRPFADGLLMLHQNSNLYYRDNEGNVSLLLADNLTKKIETHDSRLLIYTIDNEVLLYDENRQLTGRLQLEEAGYTPADVAAANNQNRLWIIGTESVTALSYDDASSTLTQEVDIPCDAYQKIYDPFSLTVANSSLYGHGRCRLPQRRTGYRRVHLHTRCCR